MASLAHTTRRPSHLRAHLSTYLTGIGVTSSLTAGAVVVFLSVATFVAFKGLPFGGWNGDAGAAYLSSNAAGSPIAAAAALGSARSAIAEDPLPAAYRAAYRNGRLLWAGAGGAAGLKSSGGWASSGDGYQGPGGPTGPGDPGFTPPGAAPPGTNLPSGPVPDLPSGPAPPIDAPPLPDPPSVPVPDRPGGVNPPPVNVPPLPRPPSVPNTPSVPRPPSLPNLPNLPRAPSLGGPAGGLLGG